jgi:hypothetical protein
LHKDYKNNSFKLIEWDHKKVSFPSGISTMDLMIFRDCEDLWDMKIEQFLKQIYDKIFAKGFLLSIFRSKYIQSQSWHSIKFLMSKMI